MFEDWITENTKNVLLIEPNFPIHGRSRNHKDFLPIGLLKIASFLREQNINVTLIRHGFNEKLVNNKSLDDYSNETPDLICVTSLFTYWSKQVKEVVQYYKKKYVGVPILVGGIYASLMPDHCKQYTGCDEVIVGQIEKAETLLPSYDLVDVDYQIIHTTRGCIRRCGVCGTYIIEPDWKCGKSIKNEIVKRKVIFYDNNILANENIENILLELKELKKEKKIDYVESQSGFDGRILLKKPYLARMIKDAKFKSPKIAWDGGIEEKENIKKQIQVLVDGGFAPKQISVFMLYNHELDFDILESKRAECFNMGVQVTNCRYRPLDSTYDNYNAFVKREQTSDEYFIHENWSDQEIRQFGRNVRRHNICIRQDSFYHSMIIEKKRISHEEAKKWRGLPYEEVDKSIIHDAWDPSVPHSIEG